MTPPNSLITISLYVSPPWNSYVFPDFFFKMLFFFNNLVFYFPSFDLSSYKKGILSSPKTSWKGYIMQVEVLAQSTPCKRFVKKNDVTFVPWRDCSFTCILRKETMILKLSNDFFLFLAFQTQLYICIFTKKHQAVTVLL